MVDWENIFVKAERADVVGEFLLLDLLLQIENGEDI